MFFGFLFIISYELIGYLSIHAHITCIQGWKYWDIAVTFDMIHVGEISKSKYFH